MTDFDVRHPYLATLFGDTPEERRHAAFAWLMLLIGLLLAFIGAWAAAAAVAATAKLTGLALIGTGCAVVRHVADWTL